MRTLRMDRIEDMNRVVDQDKSSPTYGQPRSGFHFDYFKVNHNMMPDVRGVNNERQSIYTGLPRRNMSSSNYLGIDENGTLTYQGKEPHQWSPQDFEEVGKNFDVRNLGPLSQLKSITNELGKHIAEIPGGLNGTFTYYDLLWLKLTCPPEKWTG